jgi:hypothetical protein
MPPPLPLLPPSDPKMPPPLPLLPPTDPNMPPPLPLIQTPPRQPPPPEDDVTTTTTTTRRITQNNPMLPNQPPMLQVPKQSQPPMQNTPPQQPPGEDVSTTTTTRTTRNTFANNPQQPNQPFNQQPNQPNQPFGQQPNPSQPGTTTNTHNIIEETIVNSLDFRTPPPPPPPQGPPPPPPLVFSPSFPPLSNQVYTESHRLSTLPTPTPTPHSLDLHRQLLDEQSLIRHSHPLHSQFNIFEHLHDKYLAEHGVPPPGFNIFQNMHDMYADDRNGGGEGNMGNEEDNDAVLLQKIKAALKGQNVSGGMPLSETDRLILEKVAEAKSLRAQNSRNQPVRPSQQGPPPPQGQNPFTQPPSNQQTQPPGGFNPQGQQPQPGFLGQGQQPQQPPQMPPLNPGGFGGQAQQPPQQPPGFNGQGQLPSPPPQPAQQTGGFIGQGQQPPSQIPGQQPQSAFNGQPNKISPNSQDGEPPASSLAFNPFLSMGPIPPTDQSPPHPLPPFTRQEQSTLSLVYYSTLNSHNLPPGSPLTPEITDEMLRLYNAYTPPNSQHPVDAQVFQHINQLSTEDNVFQELHDEFIRNNPHVVGDTTGKFNIFEELHKQFLRDQAEGRTSPRLSIQPGMGAPIAQPAQQPLPGQPIPPLPLQPPLPPFDPSTLTREDQSRLSLIYHTVLSSHGLPPGSPLPPLPLAHMQTLHSTLSPPNQLNPDTFQHINNLYANNPENIFAKLHDEFLRDPRNKAGIQNYEPNVFEEMHKRFLADQAAQQAGQPGQIPPSMNPNMIPQQQPFNIFQVLHDQFVNEQQMKQQPQSFPYQNNPIGSKQNSLGVIPSLVELSPLAQTIQELPSIRQSNQTRFGVNPNPSIPPNRPAPQPPILQPSIIPPPQQQTSTVTKTTVEKNIINVINLPTPPQTSTPPQVVAVQPTIAPISSISSLPPAEPQSPMLPPIPLLITAPEPARTNTTTTTTRVIEARQEYGLSRPTVISAQPPVQTMISSASQPMLIRSGTSSQSSIMRASPSGVSFVPSPPPPLPTVELGIGISSTASPTPVAPMAPIPISIPLTSRPTPSGSYCIDEFCRNCSCFCDKCGSPLDELHRPIHTVTSGRVSNIAATTSSFSPPPIRVQVSTPIQAEPRKIYGSTLTPNPPPAMAIANAISGVASSVANISSRTMPTTTLSTTTQISSSASIPRPTQGSSVPSIVDQNLISNYNSMFSAYKPRSNQQTAGPAFATGPSYDSVTQLSRSPSPIPSSGQQSTRFASTNGSIPLKINPYASSTASKKETITTTTTTTTSATQPKLIPVLFHPSSTPTITPLN